MSECTFDENDPLGSPFVYYYPNKTVIKTGRLIAISGYDKPVCIFQTDACLPDHKGGACCNTTDAIDSLAQVWYFPMICFAVPYVILNVLRKKRAAAYAKKAVAETGVPQASSAWGETFSGFSKCKKALMGTLFLAGIIASVQERIIMTRSIQATLLPTDRASQMAMSAVLTPIEEIFAFLEDTMNVKVGYALASCRYQDMNALINISAIGGLICGTLAFLLALLLTLNDSMAGALLNPSESSNRVLIDQGCRLVPTTEELLNNAKVYFVLSASTWIPSFMGKGLTGFYMGTAELVPYLFQIVVAASVPIGIWFGLLGNASVYPLTALALAYTVPAFLNTAMMFGYLVCKTSIREKFKIRCLCCDVIRSQPSNRDEGKSYGAIQRGESDGFSRERFFELLRECAVEGFQLMVVDVTIQLSGSLTNYIAASDHFEIAYKLGAAESAYWSFGPSWLMGSMMFFKLLGASIIANGRYTFFRGFFYSVGILTLSLSIGAIVAAAMKKQYVAFEYGASACIYASQEKCASSYASIFQGSDDLSTLFEYFGPTVGLNLFFIFLRASLMTCHDFHYIAKTATASFFVVYLPALFLAKFVFKSAISYYVALYIPHFALIFVFGLRMKKHLHCMEEGIDGPWTPHTRKMSNVAGDENHQEVAELFGDKDEMEKPLL
jgi:hypothetical protein